MTIKQEQLANAFTKRYKLWRASPDVRSVSARMPWDTIEREARLVGIPVDEFIDQYEVEYWYGGFDGMLVKFVKAEEKQEAKE